MDCTGRLERRGCKARVLSPEACGTGSQSARPGGRMDAGELEVALTVVDSCLPRIKWRLKPSARRRLDTDILALCSGLRPAVMVDYGGKMPELKEHLCMLMHLCHKESFIMRALRVMVIEDMIYLIHVKGLAEYAVFNPALQSQPLFVNLEYDPPKMLLFTEQNMLISGLVSIQKLFSSMLPVDEINKHLSLDVPIPQTQGTETSMYNSNDSSSVGGHVFLQSCEPIDLSSCMKDTNITIPTLNGWLLGYPVVYLFSKEHIDDAVYNLATKSLHLYKIIVCRSKASKKCEEELMSFSVPYDLSMDGRLEPWAKEFFVHMMGKLESCRGVWSDMRLEVTGCYPQAIVL